METKVEASRDGAPAGDVYEDDLAPSETHHPGPKVYVGVAAILAFVTILEVWTYYLDEVRPYLLPILLLLGFAKFALVAAYFMHLKFDSPIFKRIFVGGLLLTMGVFASVLAMSGAF